MYFSKKFDYVDCCVFGNKFVQQQFQTVLENSVKQEILPIITTDNEEEIRNNGSYFAYGYGPDKAEEVNEKDIERINQLPKEKVIAIGVCGLNFQKIYSRRLKQIELFERQIVVAREAGLPVIADIKGKNSQREFFRIMDRYPDMYERVMIHNSGMKAADICEYVSKGCWIGVNDRILVQKGFENIVSIMLIPESKMLLETGSPFTQMGSHIKIENTPLKIKQITTEISRIISYDEEEMKEKLLRNAEKFFSRI